MSILKKWAYSVAKHRKLQAGLVIPKKNAPSSCDLYPHGVLANYKKSLVK